MSVGVLDAGVAIGWIRRSHRSQAELDRRFALGQSGRLKLHLSVMNLAAVFSKLAELSKATGADPLAILKGVKVQVHIPDERVARTVSKLPTSLADGFAAATAQTLSARLHTTDGELVRQLKGTGIRVTHY